MDEEEKRIEEEKQKALAEYGAGLFGDTIGAQGGEVTNGEEQ